VAILGAQRGSFGRATLFDIREPVAEHAHPHVHLLFKLGGSDRGIEVGDEPLILGDDNCLLISPWQRHADLAEHCADTTMLALYLEPSYLAARYGTLPIPLFATASGELPPAGHSLVAEIGELLGAQADPTGRLEAAILALVDVALPRSGGTEQRPTVSDYRIRRAMARLRERPRLHPDFVSVASSVGLSRSRFFEQFKNSLGIAPTMYVDGLVLEEAIAMLVQSDRPIEDISARLGFAAQSSFSRFFKDRVGFPPGMLRHAGRPH
jgi:AraC family transcriptional regulator